MSEVDIVNLVRLFKHFDPDGDENISFDEALPMAKAFNINREELLQVFNEIDDNGDGYLQLDEWITFLKSKSNKNYIKKKIVDRIEDIEWLEFFLRKPLEVEVENLVKLFSNFDSNSDGNMSFEEALPMAVAFNLNQQELVLVFDEIDDNGDGYIQLDEWIAFLKTNSSKNYHIKKKIIDKIGD